MQQNVFIIKVFKSALAFFFLFFLHGTFKRRTELSHIAYNVLAKKRSHLITLQDWYYTLLAMIFSLGYVPYYLENNVWN